MRGEGKLAVFRCRTCRSYISYFASDLTISFMLSPSLSLSLHLSFSPSYLLDSLHSLGHFSCCSYLNWFLAFSQLWLRLPLRLQLWLWLWPQLYLWLQSSAEGHTNFYLFGIGNDVNRQMGRVRERERGHRRERRDKRVGHVSSFTLSLAHTHTLPLTPGLASIIYCHLLLQLPAVGSATPAPSPSCLGFAFVFVLCAY